MYSRGYLPRCDGSGLIQHVTIHSADSIPKLAIERIELSIKLCCRRLSAGMNGGINYMN